MEIKAFSGSYAAQDITFLLEPLDMEMTDVKKYWNLSENSF